MADEISSSVDEESSISAEKSLLGGCIQNPEIYFASISKLQTDDFETYADRVIYQDLKELRDATGNSDPTSLLEYMKSKKDLGKIGGLAYYNEIISDAPLLDEAIYYINVVKDKSIARKFFKTLKDIEDDYQKKPVTDITDFIGVAEKKILDVTQQRRVADFLSPSQVLEQLKTEANDNRKLREELHITDPYMNGYPTGFDAVDKLTGGFHPSDLIIMAARPGVGKTALALNFALNMARRGKPVGIFSLEMGATQIFLRLLSNEAGLETRKILSMGFEGGDASGTASSDEKMRLSAAIKTLQGEPIYIDDTPAMTIADIRVNARKLLQRHPDLQLLVIDYLGLITAPGHSANTSRQQEVSDITRGLKTMAKELGVPILLLCQLSREIEKREKHRPVLSDLRDSGSIEQDADMVFFIDRPDYYQGEESSKKPGSYKDAKIDENGPKPTEEQKYKDNSETILILAKNRGGRLGDVHFMFYKAFCKFVPIASSDEYDESQDPGTTDF